MKILLAKNGKHIKQVKHKENFVLILKDFVFGLLMTFCFLLKTYKELLDSLLLMLLQCLIWKRKKNQNLVIERGIFFRIFFFIDVKHFPGKIPAVLVV